MDKLELLNVLDVIKNEEVYSKRLAELKTVETKIGASRYIVKTMEEASKLRDEARELKEAAEENLRCIEEEVENRVKAERALIDTKDKELKGLQQRLNEWSDNLNKLRNQVEDENKSSTAYKVTLRQEHKDIVRRAEEVRKQELLVDKKLKLMKQAYELNE